MVVQILAEFVIDSLLYFTIHSVDVIVDFSLGLGDFEPDFGDAFVYSFLGGRN